MLPRERRVRTPADFSQTLRSGARAGRRNLVVSAHLLEPQADRAEAPDHAGAESPGNSSEQGGGTVTHEVVRVGFVVSKAVGNAVVRNRVKRRLRAAVAEQLSGPLAGHRGATVVVRALPASGSADWGELKKDLDSALPAALRKAAGRRRSGRLERDGTSGQHGTGAPA